MAKKYYRVVIVNEDNVWNATADGVTIAEAIKQFKAGQIGDKYEKGVEYHAWGVSSPNDRVDFE